MRLYDTPPTTSNSEPILLRWTRIVSVQETSEAHLEILFEQNFVSSQNIKFCEGRDRVNEMQDSVRRRVIPRKNSRTLK